LYQKVQNVGIGNEMAPEHFNRVSPGIDRLKGFRIRGGLNWVKGGNQTKGYYHERKDDQDRLIVDI
jgi:hypothetical protein